MPELCTLLLFLVAATPLCLAPGPGMLSVLSRAASQETQVLRRARFRSAWTVRPGVSYTPLAAAGSSHEPPSRDRPP